MEIHLLGRPRIVVDSHDRPSPRGWKAWGLLAFLLLGGGATSRGYLASLLFGDADDPLGALRWNLAELRRSLGPAAQLHGDPVVLELPVGSAVDVRTLASATWVEAVSVPGLGRELLEGLEIRAAAGFEAWLVAERRHVAGLSAAVLREAATARLASGSASQAVDLATRLVAFDEFDEEAHALLARAHVASGAVADARRHVAWAADLIRRELGIEPTRTLLDAVDTALASPSAGPGWIRSGDAVISLITAGEAAVAAGVVEPGFEILGRALADAREIGEGLLEARALVALGTALVHGARGRDGQGATALHAAVALARDLDAPALVSEATRELGYIEMKQARYERAAAWLDHAVEIAPAAASRAASVALQGAIACDQGATIRGLRLLDEAAAIAQDLAKPRLEAWARAFLGRGHLLRDENQAARRELTRSIEMARAAAWITFVAFPQALLATVDLFEGRVAESTAGAEAAFALGCQIGDPCWEGVAARTIGLIHHREGRAEEAVRWLDDARTRCVRIPDAYIWVHGWSLDALCEVAIEAGDARARQWVGDLEALAARTGMYELLVRADLHRVALGDPQAGATARLFADRIDNPSVLKRVRDLEHSTGAANPAPVDAHGRAELAQLARLRTRSTSSASPSRSEGSTSTSRSGRR